MPPVLPTNSPLPSPVVHSEDGAGPRAPLSSIPNNFGDIMSRRETSLHLPPAFSGLERICLTANGNLQRILSAWYNMPVTVEVLKNEVVPVGSASLVANACLGGSPLRRFDREVNIRCAGKVLCNALSDVSISDPAYLRLIEDEGVGIGQLFRYLDKLPSFGLNSVGRTRTTWWRLYTLRVPGVECRIKEVFPIGMFNEGWLEGEDALELSEEDSVHWTIEI